MAMVPRAKGRDRTAYRTRFMDGLKLRMYVGGCSSLQKTEASSKLASSVTMARTPSTFTFGAERGVIVAAIVVSQIAERKSPRGTLRGPRVPCGNLRRLYRERAVTTMARTGYYFGLGMGQLAGAARCD